MTVDHTMSLQGSITVIRVCRCVVDGQTVQKSTNQFIARFNIEVQLIGCLKGLLREYSCPGQFFTKQCTSNDVGRICLQYRKHFEVNSASRKPGSSDGLFQGLGKFSYFRGGKPDTELEAKIY